MGHEAILSQMDLHFRAFNAISRHPHSRSPTSRSTLRSKIHVSVFGNTRKKGYHMPVKWMLFLTCYSKHACMHASMRACLHLSFSLPQACIHAAANHDGGACAHIHRRDRCTRCQGLGIRIRGLDFRITCSCSKVIRLNGWRTSFFDGFKTCRWRIDFRV